MVVPNGLPTQFVNEFCFLQLRVICELIAVACLVAHRDIAFDRKIRKEYLAQKIMDQLERLLSDFFPTPLSFTFVTSKVGVAIDSPKETTLTKAELISLYGR
jgi:hypothetical protein